MDRDISLPNSNRQWWLLSITLVYAIGAIGAIGANGVIGVSNCEAAQGSESPTRKPNIVLINLDDCDVDLVSDQKLVHYPTLSKLASSSVRFTNCHVTTPLCGPSRACLFRGQYAHNTGYRTNRANLDVGSGFTGGTQYFQEAGLAADQLPVWMQNAGYHTMLVGKYFQGTTDHIPVPGWNRFIAYGGNRYRGRNTRFDFYPDGRTDIGPTTGYRTELETDDVIRVLGEYATAVDSEKPFFLYLAPIAPHVGPVGEDPIPEKWKDRFPNAELPSDASFNEDDVSDKPVAYRDTLKLSKKEIANLVIAQRRRLVSMLGIDEMVQRIQKKIADIGQQENTIVILTSDHGYLMGQQRMHGKSFPLVQATKVPLWISLPGESESRNANQLLAHIDITATVAELGGAKLPDFVDGRSFAKLLREKSIVDRDVIRKSVLVENWESRLNSVSKRKVVYSSMITSNSMYTQWATGEKEFYDLDSDPHQVDNRFESLNASQQDALQSELHSLRQSASMESGTTATLSFPTVNRKFVGPETELEGFAESAIQAEPVEVSIQRKGTGEYWNGTTWQESTSKISTEADVGAGLLREWHVEPRIAELEAGEVVTIKVHSANQSSRNDAIRELDVVYDNQPPAVRISRPVDQLGYPEFSNFGGFIEDDHAPADVKLSIKNSDSGLYFDGGQWVKEPCHVSVFLNVELGRWHVKHKLPEGRYEITVIGKDAAGNWSKSSKPVHCVVDSKLKDRVKLDQ